MKMTEDELSNLVIGRAIKIHRALGPGLLESAYHMAQILTYLRLSRCKLGLLINFHVPLLKDGVKRVIL
jgi:hypothetical protein